MKKSVLFIALSLIMLAACGGGSSEKSQIGLSPKEGVWYNLAPESTLIITSDRISYGEDGMDGFEFTGNLKMEGDKGVITFEGTDLKGSLVFNPADSTITVVIPGVMEDGSDFKTVANNSNKATIIYSNWDQPDSRTIYSDTTYTAAIRVAELYEPLEMTGLGVDWYKVALEDGKEGYVKASPGFIPSYNFIPEAWYMNSYSASIDDGNAIRMFGFEPKGGKIGVIVTTLYPNGGAASTQYQMGELHGNTIVIDSQTFDYDAFENYNPEAFENLEDSYTVRLFNYYGTPLLVLDGQKYDMAEF